ncbi:MAG TPA: alpha/beta hydrolase [Gemmatimonadales bacterium]|nr:alpha/beta hydrolase [Gemmatimonadales bacterium]
MAPPPPPPAAPRPTDSPLRLLAVNGTRLAYRLSGDSGAPVVFVHGSFSDYRSWRGQENAFSRVFKVLVYSRRYHRPNPQVADTNQAYSPKVHAEDLAALLLTLDLAPAHIVGSSYGAYVALALARDHPNLVRSLVLAEPPIVSLLTISEAGDAERRSFFLSVLDPTRRAFARGDSVGALRAFYDGLNGRGQFDNLPATTRADLLTYSFELRQEMLANREQYYPPVSCGELGRVTTPVLLVRGAQSPPVFQIISDELARCLQSDTTAVIPGAGHPPHLANPVYYNQTVGRFLASH